MQKHEPLKESIVYLELSLILNVNINSGSSELPSYQLTLQVDISGTYSICQLWLGINPLYGGFVASHNLSQERGAWHKLAQEYVKGTFLETVIVSANKSYHTRN